nr:hypothetical protein CFP56_19501 [Quercus suber]
MCVSTSVVLLRLCATSSLHPSSSLRSFQVSYAAAATSPHLQPSRFASICIGMLSRVELWLSQLPPNPAFSPSPTTVALPPLSAPARAVSADARNKRPADDDSPARIAKR